MALFSLTLVLLVFSYNVFVFCDFDEPVCSKFHFEEKVLEKLIKLEVKVDNELKKISESNLENTDRLKIKVENELRKFSESTLRNSDRLKIKVENELRKISESNSRNTERQNRMDEAVDGLTRENEETKSKLAEKIGELQDEISKMADLDDLKNVQADVAVLEERIARKSEGLDPVFFVVHRTSTSSLPQNKPVIYQTELSNEGDGYDDKTGVFTAPRNGVYIEGSVQNYSLDMFSAQICAGNQVHYQIQVNDVPYSSSYQYSSSGECSSVTTTALLSTYDRVSVVIIGGGVHVKNTNSGLPVWNMFSGTLVA